MISSRICDSRIVQILLIPFTVNSVLKKELIFVFIIINTIVLVNTVKHNPQEGYDSHEHTKYFQALSKANLPTSNNTKEFFSPPVPYIVPAITYRICKLFEFDFRLCTHTAGKIGQISNFILSVGTTITILLICMNIYPDNSHFRLLSLVLIGILPVYYKTFAFVRGEPYVIFFTVIIFYLLTLLLKTSGHTKEFALLLSLLIAGLLLSRQWGFLVIGALILVAVLLIKTPSTSTIRRRTPFILMLAIILGISLSSVFYVTVSIREGMTLPFNRASEEWSLSNQSTDFYFGTGDGQLFRAPSRPNFDNQFIPIFYSEIWGDYWHYFTVLGDNVSEDFVRYLGRVNLLSLIPTIILFFGVIGQGIKLVSTSASSQTQDIDWDVYYIELTALLIIITSLVGYFWFLIRYPIYDGDTIKATYMLHIFPLAGILTAGYITKVLRVSTWAIRAILIIIGMIFLHNLSATISRYS